MIVFIARALSATVIVLCGLIMLAVLIFAPELVPNWESEPEGLVGSLLLVALSFAVATVLGLHLVGRGGRLSKGVGIVLAACLAISAVLQFLSGGWPIALITSVVAVALLMGVTIGMKPRKS